MRRRIIGAGIIPGGMEMMDRPAIHAAEEFVHAGYPLDVEALLIVELDGPQAEVDHLIARVEAIAQRMPRRDLQGVHLRGRSGCCSGPAARPRSRRSDASRPTITAWTAPSRARGCRRCCARMRELSEHYGLRGRQRVPRRRRQPASAHPLRRQQAGRARTHRGVRRRYPEALRGGRRRADRRARRRRREARPDAGDVHRGRSQPAAAAQMRLRRPRACSIPARCFRRCTAVPSSAACTCTPARWRFRTFRGSEPWLTRSNRATPKMSRTPFNGRSARARRWK